MNLWWNCTHSGAKKFHIGVRVIHAWIQKNMSYLKEWIIQYQSNLYKYKLDWGSIRLSLFSYKLGRYCFHSWQFNFLAIPSLINAIKRLNCDFFVQTNVTIFKTLNGVKQTRVLCTTRIKINYSYIDDKLIQQ